jgi:hypothetical protein
MQFSASALISITYRLRAHPPGTYLDFCHSYLQLGGRSNEAITYRISLQPCPHSKDFFTFCESREDVSGNLT